MYPVSKSYQKQFIIINERGKYDHYVRWIALLIYSYIYEYTITVHSRRFVFFDLQKHIFYSRPWLQLLNVLYVQHFYAWRYLFFWVIGDLKG